MTLPSTYPKEIKNGNDSTTVFSFGFIINKSADLVVTHTSGGVETVLVEGTGTSNYSVSVTDYPGTGSITYPATLGTELATGDTLTLQRIVTIEQQTDLINQGAWKPEQVEAALDYSRMINLQQQVGIDSSMRLPVSVEGVSTVLPVPAALKTLRWNAAGTALEAVDLVAPTAALSDATPQPNSGSGAAGTSSDISRADHAHPASNVVDDTTPQLGGFLDPNSNYVGSAKGADIASANPLVIGTDGDMFDVTGTTDFTSMTVAANRRFQLQFDGILTGRNGAPQVFPGGANVTTAVGDIWDCRSIFANTVVITNIAKADGTAVVESSGGLVSMQVFTTTRTWTKPAGVTKVKVTVVSAGGGGGGAEYVTAANGGAGGGGGGSAIEIIDVTGTSSETITIGAGGAGGRGTNDGVDGSASSFGAFCSATGGGGGVAGAGHTVWSAGGAGGVASGGDANIDGGKGGDGIGLSDYLGVQAGDGGGSILGEGGKQPPSAVGSRDGDDGSGYGSGGSGAATQGTTPMTGGDGTDGIVIVEEYA